MTNEEKQLLIKDLCARSPYGIKVCYIEHEYGIKSTWDVDYIIPNNGQIITKEPYGRFSINDVKPYLRPMSLMTKEEIKEYHNRCEFNDCDYTGKELWIDTIESFDYLNSIGIDYRGLIRMGLALEAKEGMYNSNN